MENPPSEKKFWEGPYPNEQAPLENKGIQNMAENLKRGGYHFELTEDQSEYVLRVEGFQGVIHVTKVADSEKVNVRDILEKRITHPES